MRLALRGLSPPRAVSVALMAYSILVNAYSDVVCLPIVDAPADFHKIYLMSRKERHSKIVSEFIAFMEQREFPLLRP